MHVDLDGTILNQNAASVEVAGESDQEAIRGRAFWDVFVDPLDREGDRDAVRGRRTAAPRGRVREHVRQPARAAAGGLLALRALADEHGRTTAIIAGGIDITARHEEAEARERERAFLNAIANEAPSLLCLIDERGVLAPMASNKAFERTLEVAPEETGGTVFWDAYVAPEDSARVRALIGRVAAGETVGHHDHTWITKSGSVSRCRGRASGSPPSTSAGSCS